MKGLKREWSESESEVSKLQNSSTSTMRVPVGSANYSLRVQWRTIHVESGHPFYSQLKDPNLAVPRGAANEYYHIAMSHVWNNTPIATADMSAYSKLSLQLCGCTSQVSQNLEIYVSSVRFGITRCRFLDTQIKISADLFTHLTQSLQNHSKHTKQCGYVDLNCISPWNVVYKTIRTSHILSQALRSSQLLSHCIKWLPQSGAWAEPELLQLHPCQAGIRMLDAHRNFGSPNVSVRVCRP